MEAKEATKMYLNEAYKYLKGQFTIISLVMVLIMIIVYSQLYPVIEPFLATLINDSDPATATLVGLIPFFIALAVIMSVLWYVIPQRGK